MSRLIEFKEGMGENSGVDRMVFAQGLWEASPSGRQTSIRCLESCLCPYAAWISIFL